MNVEAYLTAAHEAHHAAAGVFLGRKIKSVKRYGQHGIAKGCGVTEFEVDDSDLAGELHRGLVCLWAGILGAPYGADGDLRVVESLRRDGFAAEVNLARAAARVMLQDPRYRKIRYAIESALMQQPWLSGADVALAVS